MRYYYWGPLLTKTKLKEQELIAIKNLCIKDESKIVRDRLVANTKEEFEIDIKDLPEILRSHISDYCYMYKRWYGRDCKNLKPNEAWVNYMNPGDYNPIHQHLDCDISCVIYVDIPKELELEIKDYVGRSLGPGSILFLYGENNRQHLTWHEFKPEAGDIFLFPSTLRHTVNPYKSNCQRVSVAINFNIEV